MRAIPERLRDVSCVEMLYKLTTFLKLSGALSVSLYVFLRVSLSICVCMCVRVCVHIQIQW